MGFDWEVQFDWRFDWAAYLSRASRRPRRTRLATRRGRTERPTGNPALHTPNRNKEERREEVGMEYECGVVESD